MTDKNFTFSCPSCGWIEDDDDVGAYHECRGCGYDEIQVTQNNYRKCTICGREIIPDENNWDYSSITGSGDVYAIYLIEDGYYTDEYNIDIDDMSRIEIVHGKCYRALVQRVEALEKKVKGEKDD